MGYRVDACRVEIDVAIEFEGRTTIRFDLPPDHQLVAALLQWNDARLLALAKAAGEATGLL
jgi:hypothetical protein